MPQAARVTFTAEEILANVPVEKPLIVSGVKCHGGFTADGKYVSPRTLWRVPAIKAWQQQHLVNSGMPLVEIPASAVPPRIPNVAQAKYLLAKGVREPMVRWLTEISIIEGFGAQIRDLPVPPLKSFIKESTNGTTLEHLTRGLFEAHARDEAGWSEEGGHRQMWEAVRDSALSNPEISPEIMAAIIGRRTGEPPAMFPALGAPVERLLRFMVNVLAIEVFATSTFEWAEAVLSDREVSDAPVEAGNLVLYISSDETPHVEYLRTGLSEVSARTLLTEDGKEIAGKQVVDALMDRSLRAMIRQRLVDQPKAVREMIRHTAKVRDLNELMAGFDALATPWIPPTRYADLSPAPAAGASPGY